MNAKMTRRTDLSEDTGFVMIRDFKSIAIFSLLLLFVVVPSLNAQWVGDGVAICTATSYQETPQITSDGAGGAIITWKDIRLGDYDIFAQRVDSSGNVQWTTDGVVICTAPGYQEYPQIISDGSGGAIITWNGSDIYAQRIDASGNIQWTADGVAICTASGTQRNPQITSDGTGGAIITWEDFRNGNMDIYTQRIGSSGNVQWTADGVAICTAMDHQVYHEITSDGAGGAIITWHDSRSGTDYDIYAQRIDASGNVQWTTDGVAICTETDSQYYTKITSDSSGGAIITWEDFRSGTNTDIYAQRIDASGNVQWTADGVAICTAMDEQLYAQLTPDGTGGAIIIWADCRNWYCRLFAQRIDASGNVQWTIGGVACTAMNEEHQYEHRITSDGAGGAIITWHEYRTEDDADIFLQRIDADGNIMWIADGVAICTAISYQKYPQLTSDGAGGAIVTWEDYRNAPVPNASDIYAARVDRNGNSPPTHASEVPSADYLEQNFPNPFNPSTKIIFGIKDPANVSLRIYDTSGRLIRVLVEKRMDAGRHEVDWDGRESNGREVASGVYFYHLSAGGFKETNKMVLIR